MATTRRPRLARTAAIAAVAGSALLLPAAAALAMADTAAAAGPSCGDQKQPHHPGGWRQLPDAHLSDGWCAHVYVNNKSRSMAQLWHGQNPIGWLSSGSKPSAVRIDNRYFILKPNGQLTMR